jgi:O-antigen/teichoic acid export membrane protein
VFQRIRQLFAQVVIYGLGDVATSVVSFLLLPLYLRYLSPDDYGVLSLLLTTEVVTKIVFRWGIDASFMRLYYDCTDQAARQRLASSQVWFLVTMNGAILIAAWLLTPLLGHHLFHTGQYTLTLRLVFLNTFVVGFYYLPFHVMRIEEQSRVFISLNFSRSLATLVMRLVFVIGLRLGVLGIVLADVAVTAVFTPVLGRWYLRLIRPVFSRELLRESLRFGLPRIPHGVAHQIIAVFDRYILARFVSLHELGLYSVGASVGLAMKLFLSAFEYAWAPLYFGTMNEPNAKEVFSRITTYGVAVLVLLAAGLAAIANDLIGALASSQFHHAARIVPWIALGVALQGVYLLTSIGLNITKHTEYYPVATGLAAATSIAMNLLLIPLMGIVGSAIANAVAYAVLAAVSWHFSNRFYPIAYERGRIARVILAGAAAWAIARWLPLAVHPVAALLARGCLVVVTFVVLLAVTGFLAPNELGHLNDLIVRIRRRRTIESSLEATEMAGGVVAAPLTDTAEAVGEPFDGTSSSVAGNDYTARGTPETTR